MPAGVLGLIMLLHFVQAGRYLANDDVTTLVPVSTRFVGEYFTKKCTNGHIFCERLFYHTP